MMSQRPKTNPFQMTYGEVNQPLPSSRQGLAGAHPPGRPNQEFAGRLTVKPSSGK